MHIQKKLDANLWMLPEPSAPANTRRLLLVSPLFQGRVAQNLDPQRATERPGGIVRLRTVVIHEDMVEAAIAKEGALEFPDFRRCFHPARRFRIELSKFLQLSILFFRQKLDAHGSCHIHSGIFWPMFFPCL